MTGNFARNIFSVALLGLFAVGAAGSVETDSNTEEIQSQITRYTLAAEQLYAEYSANEVAADNKYKGQIVAVWGVVGSIGKDIMDQAYVVLGEEGSFGVQCLFSKGEEGVVANLSKGQRISVKGKLSGKMGNVLLRNCQIQ